MNEVLVPYLRTHQLTVNLEHACGVQQTRQFCVDECERLLVVHTEVVPTTWSAHVARTNNVHDEKIHIIMSGDAAAWQKNNKMNDE